MTEHKLDFDALNEKVTIQQVAENMLGVKLRPIKDELRGCCPISQSTNPRHFCITPRMNRYVCFCDHCKTFPRRGGDGIELVRRAKKLETPLQAAKEIQAHFGLNGSPPAQPEKPKSDFNARAYQRKLQPHHDALKDCGVSGETIEAWGGGFATGNGALGGRLALPLCDMDGTPTGFVGLSLKDEDPDLKYPAGVEIPHFFGVHKIQGERNLHIVYHPLDVLLYSEDGYNVIAVLCPITHEVLMELAVLMETKRLTDLDFH